MWCAQALQQPEKQCVYVRCGVVCAGIATACKQCVYVRCGVVCAGIATACKQCVCMRCGVRRHCNSLLSTMCTCVMVCALALVCVEKPSAVGRDVKHRMRVEVQLIGSWAFLNSFVAGWHSPSVYCLLCTYVEELATTRLSLCGIFYILNTSILLYFIPYTLSYSWRRDKFIHAPSGLPWILFSI